MTQRAYIFAAAVALAGACSHAADSELAPTQYPKLPPTAVEVPALGSVDGIDEGQSGEVTHAGSASIKQGTFDALVEAADRSQADRALDDGRRPAQLLAFLDVTPGQRVAELASGTGYTAELLARAVGKKGKLYGVNNDFILEKFAQVPWTQRLATPVMKNVTRVDREFDSPFPDDVVELDMVCNVLFYHDTVWMGTDRSAMNAHVFRALKTGGTYVVVDHSALEGHGIADVRTLHRIEESLVRQEVEAAGFKFVESGDFLRNSDDARDWNASPSAAGERRGTSDRFVLKFVKP